MQCCCIVFRTILLHILSSIRIFFASVTLRTISSVVSTVAITGSFEVDIVMILVAFMESLLITAERGAYGAAGCADALSRRSADSEGCGPPGEGNKASMIRITLYGARSARVQ